MNKFPTSFVFFAVREGFYVILGLAECPANVAHDVRRRTTLRQDVECGPVACLTSMFRKSLDYVKDPRTLRKNTMKPERVGKNKGIVNQE